MANKCVNLEPYNSSKIEGLKGTLIAAKLKLTPENIEDVVKRTLEDFLGSLLHIKLDTRNTGSIKLLIKNIGEIVDSFISKEESRKFGNSAIDKNRQEQSQNKIKSLKAFKKAITEQLRTPLGDDVVEIEETKDQTTNKENDEEFKNHQRIEDFERTIFGTAFSPKMYRRQLFSQDIFKMVIANTATGAVVTTNDDLNDNIMDLKNAYYKDIVAFLNSIGQDSFSSYMFDEDGELDKGYIKALNAFYKYLTENEDTTPERLKFGWRRLIKGEDDLFYRAASSYFNLYYFDSLLVDEIGRVVNIDKNFRNYEVSRDLNKYSFSTESIADLAKGWETQDNRDAISEWSKFSKVVISAIPMYNRRDGRRYANNVTTVTFANAFSGLFNAIMYNESKGGISKEGNIADLLSKLHSSPNTFIKQGLQEVLQVGNLRKLIGKGLLSSYDADVLYSINKFLFEPKTGIEDVEANYTINNFANSSYSIMDTIMGVVDRTMAINYLENKIGPDGETIISIKSKFPKRQREMNLRNSINSQTINRKLPQRLTLYKKYNIKEGSNNTWTFTIGDKEYSVKGQAGHTMFTAQLDKVTLSGEIPDINIANKVDILLGDESNLSTNELQFKRILQFIEDNLQPIKLLSDVGLDKLIIAEMNNSGIVKELLIAASRAAIINKLYLDYAQSDSEENFYNYTSKKYPSLKMQSDGSNRTLFVTGLGTTNLATTRVSDSWVDDWAVAEAGVYGDISRANTKDTFGNAIGNYSTSFLGGNLLYYLYQSKNVYNPHTKLWEPRVNSAQANLLMAAQPDLVQGVVVNTDSTSRAGVKKLTRNMKTGELLYQSVFHNFFGASFTSDGLLSGAALVQPTTYSDKVKTIQYAINTNAQLSQNIVELSAKRTYVGKNLYQLSESEILDLYLDTIGNYYKQVYTNTINKFQTMFGVEGIKAILDKFAEINSDATILNKEEYLVSLAEQNGITLVTESDYRTDKQGNIYFNELLDYYVNYLYAKKSNLQSRLNKEKINFINDIIDSNIIFYTNFTNSDDLKQESIVMQVIDAIFSQEGNIIKEQYKEYPNGKKKYLQDWVKDGRLILAKSSDGTEYIMGNRIATKKAVTLNPILNLYFMLYSLLSNNLRFSLTGTELAHPTKMTPMDLSKETPDWKKLEEKAFEIETKAQGAQLKRNVIIPATLQYYKLDTLKGVASTFNMAVAKDLKAVVYNFMGEIEEGLDSSDGACFTTATTSILENNSLQDLKVGDIKKTILHSPNYETGGVVLGKWATFALTNELISDSLSSDVNLYEINKKLTNIPWYINGQINSRFIDGSRIIEFKNKVAVPTVIDLTKVRGIVGLRNLDFVNDILQGKNLYYRDYREALNGKPITVIYSIKNFGKENGFYYTDIVDVVNGMELNSTKQRIYHAYDAMGNHFTFNDITKIPEGFTTINSNHQLWEALGGLQSVQLEDGKWVQSEDSNYATVAFMNLVAFEQSQNRRDLTQHNYYQPLKHAQISYLANSTSIKNSAANINQSDFWKNPNSIPHFMQVLYDGIGVQMDADHEADESQLTEPSQVMTSLAAGGRVHDISRQIYQDLESIALQTSSTELSALEEFLEGLRSRADKNQEISELYDIVVRTIINNFKNENLANLTDELLDKVRKHINENVSHSKDEYKLPFSDPGVYGSLMPTFASLINNKSVKRKYPGSGYVMHPSYGFKQIYDLRLYDFDTRRLTGDFAPHQFSDIFDMYKSRFKKAPNESYVQYQLRVVKSVLDIQQNNQIVEERLSGLSKDRFRFLPNNKLIVRISSADGNYRDVQLDLSNPKDYVTFKQDYWEFLVQGKTDTNGKIVTLDDIRNGLVEFFTDLTRGRDLMPAKITWKDTKGRNWNIFDTQAVRASFTLTAVVTDSEGNTHNILVPKLWKNSTITRMLSVMYPGYTLNSTIDSVADKAAIQATFDNLHKGFFINEEGQKENISDLLTTAAEVIMSSMNRTKFPDHTSLPSVLLHKNNFKVKRLTSFLTDAELLLLKQNKLHAAIKLGEVVSDINDINTPQLIKWDNIKPVYRKNSKGEVDENNILIYTLTKDSTLQYPIGYAREKTSYRFTDDNKVVDSKGQAVKGEFIKGNNGEVLEIEYFVKKYTVVRSGQDKKVQKHILYTVNPNTILSAKQSISNIIGRIFSEEQAMELRLNSNIQPSENLARWLSRLSFDNPYMNTLQESIIAYLNGAIDAKQYNSAISSFYENLSNAAYTSFLRQREVTASRIPAQTLQSFMQMNTVGYTRSRKNVCYVTPWQTYLQGSDYDIDKAYIIGCEIDKNGLYVAWSPLFDYSTLETLKASEKLPFPSGKTIMVTNEGWDISDHIDRLRAASATGSVQYLTELSNFLYEINSRVSGENYKVRVRADLEEDARKFVGQINQHQRHKLSLETKEAAYRNSIAARINLVVQHVRNMNHAYSPIKIENIRPDKKSTKTMSLMNPATIFEMQVQNMVGKGVIGITAVGEKIFFNLTNYWNETLRNRPDKYYNLAFSKTFNRLQGRYSGNVEPKTVTKLANVNFDFDGIEIFADKVNEINTIFETTLLQFPEVADRNSLEYLDLIQSQAFLDKLHENIRRAHDSEDAIDLFISELLSAATDNAKELVLAQINAGLDLAGNYLYLLTLGFNVKDIMAFMTSPAINTINSLSESNMFIDLFKALNIDNIVDLLLGDFKPLLGKLDINSKVKPKYENIHEYIKARISGKETETLEKIAKINSSSSDFMEIVINKIKNNLGTQSYEDYLSDLKEFKVIKDSASEATSLGTVFLGLNLGLPASEVDLLNKIRGIKKIIDDREELLGIDHNFIKDLKKDLKDKEFTVENLIASEKFREKVELLMQHNPELARLLGKEYFSNILAFALAEHEKIDGTKSSIAANFDPREWIMNDKYKNFIVNYYNIIKDTWNVFDVMAEVPQYRALIKLLQLEYVANHYLSVKSNIVDKVHSKLLEQGRYLDDNMLKSLISYVDDRIIDSWFNQEDLEIPIIEGWNYFTPNAAMQVSVGDSLIRLDSAEGRASFKYIMENYIIPGLQDGTLPEITIEHDGYGNKLVAISEKQYDLSENPFILGLIQDQNRDGIPYYKLNMDMMNIDATPATQQLFLNYLDGLIELRGILLGGMSLSNWFMVYNLYVNKNNYGQDRLTSIFRSFILTIKGDNILNDYYSYIGDLDYNFKESEILEKIGINFEDINLAMAKVISKRMENNELSQYIKEYENGYPIYKRKTRNGFTEINMFPSKTLAYDAETNLDKAIQSNIVQYFLRYLPNQGNIEYYRRLLNSTREEDILEALTVMQSKGLISINIFNC